MLYHHEHLFFLILTSLLTYIVPTEHHRLPENLAHTRTARAVLNILPDVEIYHLENAEVCSLSDTWKGYKAVCVCVCVCVCLCVCIGEADTALVEAEVEALRRVRYRRYLAKKTAKKAARDKKPTNMNEALDTMGWPGLETRLLDYAELSTPVHMCMYVTCT